MTAENYAHYIAKGSAIEAIEEAMQIKADEQAAFKALLDEVGADGALSNGRHVTAFSFAGEAPSGWRNAGTERGVSYFKPYRKKAADKALWDRMHDTRLDGAQTRLGRYVLKDRSFVMTNYGGGPASGGFYLRNVGAEKFGDTWVISVPLIDADQPAAEPEDADRIPLSEYYRLREAKEAA